MLPIRDRAPLAASRNTARSCYRECLTIVRVFLVSVQVWFIEKCRVLETEKLQLVSRLAEVEATSGKVSARIDTMKQGNKALKVGSAGHRACSPHQRSVDA